MSSRVRYSSIPRDQDRNFFTRLEPATSSLRTPHPLVVSSEPNCKTLPNRSTHQKYTNIQNDSADHRKNGANRTGRSAVKRRPSQCLSGPTMTGSGNSSKSSSLPTHAVDASPILDPLGVPPEELASQITLMDLPVFQSITSEELLSCSWNKKNKLEIAPQIVAFTRRFNHVSFWAVEEILKYDDPRSRADVMSHFIKLAKRLHELNNLHSEFAVLSALQTASVFRLTKTWNLLSRNTRQTFDRLKDLFSDSDNWGRLRDHMNSTALKHNPCIPYLGLYLTDLMMVDIAHPSTGGLESQQRQLKMNNILRIVSELQQSTYSSLTILPPVQAYLSSIRFIDELQKFIEDDQFKISQRLEPPNPASSPPVSSSSSKESVRQHQLQLHNGGLDHHHHHHQQHHNQDLAKELGNMALSPARRSGCIPRGTGKGWAPGHRKSRSEGGNILFGCGGGGGLASPDLPHGPLLHKRTLIVNSMDSLDHDKTHSLLDGSLLDDPSPGCGVQSPVYSPDSEREVLTPTDPLAFNTLQFQPGSMRTFQGCVQRKTLIKDGRRPLVSSWQRYWLELWDSSLVYYLPKTLSKCRERRDYKSEPCKLRSVGGWIVMVPQQSNTEEDSFQLADPVMRNVYRFRGELKDRSLWVYHLTRASRGVTTESIPANLISFE